MKPYKDMSWEELEECANAIREELIRMDDNALLWESRGISPDTKHYERVEELQKEIDYIQSLQFLSGYR